MFLFLDSYKGNYVLIFILSFIIFTIWEYFVGWLLEKLFNTKYWDYSYYKFQIKGRICLINSITWGFLGIGFIELIHPIITFLISFININVLNVITIILSIFIVIDIIITIIKLKEITINLKKLAEITSNLKEKIKELKQMSEKKEEKTKNSERLKAIVEELKQKQLELKKSIDKKTQRLRMAFPKINIEKINTFLKKEINFKNDRKRRK